MRKFVAVLIFLTLMIAGLGAWSLTIRAYDVNADPAPGPDINADILRDGFPTGEKTPHTFGLPGPGPSFTSGVYSCRRVSPPPTYHSWLPQYIFFNTVSANVSFSFYAMRNDDTPAELSSFTATLTAQNFVNLTWVSQSETAMLGYRVYRSESNSQAAATLITPTMIPATNTSATQTYSISDVEVEIDHTYYYWLEAVDMGASTFHGPVSVIVEGEVPPVLPTVSNMRSAYPNPFKASATTTIVVDVKADENGTVSIYNIMGQVVKTVQVTPGTHNIQWNGKDNNGNNCGSGVYFYKLSTPSVNQTKKLVIVK